MFTKSYKAMQDQDQETKGESIEVEIEDATEETEEATADSAETTEQVLEAKEKELKEANDRMLRFAAELENAKRRWDKEKKEIHQYSMSNFARDLLPVLDAFDKALTSIGQLDIDGETQEGKQVLAVVEGVKLVQKSFFDAFSKHGVEKVPGAGEAFDPNFHNAIAKTVDESLEKETVLEEFQPGYKIGDRVLRTAMVRVASPD